MADGVEAASGSGGPKFKTDEDTSFSPAQHVPIVKIELGADNTFGGYLSSSNPMPVNSGTGASDFAKAEDAAHTTGDVGVMALSVRRDTNATSAGTDGDYASLNTDSGGYLWVRDKAVSVEGASVGSGILIQGDDGTDRKNINVDATTGDVQVDVTNTVTVSGTITADAGTNLNTSALALESGGNLATIAGAVSGSEMQVDIVGALPAGTNTIGKLSANSGVDIGDVDVTSVIPGTGASNLGKAEDAAHTTGDVGVMPLAVRNDGGSTLASADGDYTPLGTDANGYLHVRDRASGPEGASLLNGMLMQGDDGTDRKNVAVDAASGNMQVDLNARTSGGATPYRNIDVNETKDQVKGTAGQVYSIYATNLASSVRYLHFYDATSASVTVGTTTPDLTFSIPTQGDSNGAGFSHSVSVGYAFNTAITIAATTGFTGAGAPAANEVQVNLGYA